MSNLFEKLFSKGEILEVKDQNVSDDQLEQEPQEEKPQEMVLQEQYTKLKELYENLQTDYQNLKLKSEQDAITIEELATKIKELSKDINSSTPSEAKVDNQSQNIVSVEDIVLKMSNMIENEHSKLIDLCRETQQMRDKVEDKFDALWRQVQEDRYKKDKIKILMRLIRMREMIEDMLIDYKSEKMEGCETPSALFLQSQLFKLIDCIEVDLKQEMVFKIESAIEGADFDDEHMEAVGFELTDNPMLAGKVCKSVSPGYYWTLPYILKPRITDNGEEVYSYKFIISYEQVITFKYLKDNE